MIASLTRMAPHGAGWPRTSPHIMAKKFATQLDITQLLEGFE
jgi:hypothetical protein